MAVKRRFVEDVVDVGSGSGGGNDSDGGGSGGMGTVAVVVVAAAAARLEKAPNAAAELIFRKSKGCIFCNWFSGLWACERDEVGAEEEEEADDIPLLPKLLHLVVELVRAMEPDVGVAGGGGGGQVMGDGGPRK